MCNIDRIVEKEFRHWIYRTFKAMIEFLSDDITAKKLAGLLEEGRIIGISGCTQVGFAGDAKVDSASPGRPTQFHFERRPLAAWPKSAGHPVARHVMRQRQVAIS
jgi:hypothetical protein